MGVTTWKVDRGGLSTDMQWNEASHPYCPLGL